MKRFERTLDRVLEVESVQHLRSQVLALVSMVAHFLIIDRHSSSH